MKLKFRKNDGYEFGSRLLPEKIEGVSLPYLHVKKDGKTYYLPMIESDAPEIMGRLFSGREKTRFKFIYKGKEYFPLLCRKMEEIGVITLVNGEIHQSINFKYRCTFFNKAKQLALYDGNEEPHKKLMDINYDDVIYLWHTMSSKPKIVNLTTGETVTDYSGYKYLEFKEE